MPSGNLFEEVVDFIAAVNLATGLPLDEWLSGYRVAEAVHIDVDPAIEAIVRTELQIDGRVSVDLRELVEAAPPIDAKNLFVTFNADSAHFRGFNAETFGIHLTDMDPEDEIVQSLREGIFLTGAEVDHAWQLIIYVQSPNEEITLARTGIAVGFDIGGRLVSYLTFEIDPDLSEAHLNPPSRLTGSDQQVILYVFLALTAFMSVNQGEAPIRTQPDGTITIG
jgi:hypothetical protein